MADVALIEDGVVAQVWRATSIASAESGLPAGDHDLVEFPPGVAVCGMQWDGEALSLPAPTPLEIPPEIPMHKVRKALKQLGPDGEVTPETYANSWWSLVMGVINALENPIQRDCILDELSTAPNMVLAGASTLMIAAAIGMSHEQLEDVARLALTLP